MMVLQSNSKVWNKKFTNSEILIKKFKMRICCRGPNGEQYSEQGRIKELKHLKKTL